MVETIAPEHIPGQSSGRRPPRRFPWLPLAILVVVGLVFAAILAEIGLRVGEIRADNLADLQCAGAGSILSGQKGLFQIDPLAGYVMRPDLCVRLRSPEYDQVLRTNSHGQVGPELPATKAPGEFRILVLGDSYTAGGQVPYEQNFTALLEDRLHADGHANVRVVNGGVGGYSTYNEAGYLQENSAWIQPDLVVVIAFLGNDQFENVLATAAGYQDAPWHPKGVTWGNEAQKMLDASPAWFPRNGVAGDVPPPWNPGDPLPTPVGNQPASSGPAVSPPGPADGSAWAWVRFHAHQVWDGARAQSLLLGRLFGTPIDPSVTTAPGAEPVSAQQRRLNVTSFEWAILKDRPRTYWLDVAWPLFGQYLGQINNMATSMGAKAIVVAMPQMGQFDEEAQQRTMANFRFSPDEVDWDRPQRDLAQQVAEAGLPELDLLPIFQSRPDRSQLYLRLDTHMSALGHQATADAIADYVEQGGYLR